MLALRWIRVLRTIAPALAICAAGLAMSCDHLDPPDGLAKTPAEALAVLQKFVGQWQTETRLTRPAADPTKPSHTTSTKGRATCEKTLAGRYFEFRAETVPPGQSDLQIMTFDSEASVYRQRVFSSDGYRHEATGTWNAATNTLRWTGKSGDTSFVILDHWISADRLEWTLTRTDPAGNVVQTITGVVSRAAER